HAPPAAAVLPLIRRPAFHSDPSARALAATEARTRPLSRGRGASAATRARDRRRLVEARHVPGGPASLLPGASVPPRRETGQLWEALRPLFRGGDRRGPVHLRTRGGGPPGPREVR